VRFLHIFKVSSSAARHSKSFSGKLRVPLSTNFVKRCSIAALRYAFTYQKSCEKHMVVFNSSSLGTSCHITDRQTQKTASKSHHGNRRLRVVTLCLKHRRAKIQILIKVHCVTKYMYYTRNHFCHLLPVYMSFGINWKG
jgi:hypothetical protein